ncbi:MAG: VCBS repeat-containing protein, partial [Opitutaceae bacterium]|nr:VCBS repeat-containing protein [Verrucomicrobiales bacterium]
EKLKYAAFVDLNNDGYPDVLVSTLGGGLHACLNPGAAGGNFKDATAGLGLDQEACGTSLTGYFSPGDWNGDGRTDLFYAVGNGLLLVQGADGRFQPLKHDLDFDFKTDGKADGLTGACVFAPLWSPGQLDLVATAQYKLQWVGMRRNMLLDLIPYGNEIWEGTDSMGPVIAEDLNADGNVDIFTGSRVNQRNAIHGNRGYGSFTTPVLHKPNIFPGPAYQHGALGLAAGDADGDGANDLLIGGADGNLVFVPNAALAERAPKEHPTLMQQVLERTKILTVHVSGKVGVLGATVILIDDKDRVVGKRVIGSNVATGCRGPDTINFAVREPGPLTVTVRFSDGKTKSWPVDLATKERRLALEASHD